MKKKELLERVTDLAAPICAQGKVALWDVTFEKEGPDYFLTLFIDKEGGIFVEDCEFVSRAIDPLLDAPEFDDLPSYMLTVSSPGIQRRLNRDAHFEWAIGREVELTFFKKGSPVIGVLAGYDGKTLKVEAEGEIREIEKVKVSLARIHFDYSKK